MDGLEVCTRVSWRGKLFESAGCDTVLLLWLWLWLSVVGCGGRWNVVMMMGPLFGPPTKGLGKTG